MIHPINHLPPVIRVGIQAESGVEAIGFDLSPWLARWPGMTFAVWPTRPGESASYIAADTELVGNVLYWYPNAADTEKEGAGTVELIGVGGGKRKSSGVIDTLVKKTSLDVTQETPEPFKPWAEKIMEAADVILNATPSETVILPETDLVRVEDDSSYLFVLPTPWENDVVAGNSYKVTYNGVVYDLKATKASDLMPDAVPGMLVLGNYSIMGMEGGDAKVPFCLAAYPNAAGAEMGGYAALVSNDGAESVTLSVTEYASVAPAELPKITLTIDEDGTVTSDTPFAEASKMTCGELQSALKVVQTGNYAGQPAALEADVQVRRRVTEAMGEMLEITFRQFADPGDYAAAKEVTRYIYWAEQAIQLAPIVLTSLPVMNNWGFDQQTYYLRSVGGVWQPATIDQLKADLGLT